MEKFEIFNGEDGQFYFRLKAPNGEVVAVSEGYTQKHNAKNGIEAIKQYASKAKIVDLA